MQAGEKGPDLPDLWAAAARLAAQMTQAMARAPAALMASDLQVFSRSFSLCLSPSISSCLSLPLSLSLSTSNGKGSSGSNGVFFLKSPSNSLASFFVKICDFKCRLISHIRCKIRRMETVQVMGRTRMGTAMRTVLDLLALRLLC